MKESWSHITFSFTLVKFALIIVQHTKLANTVTSQQLTDSSRCRDCRINWVNDDKACFLLSVSKLEDEHAYCGTGEMAIPHYTGKMTDWIMNEDEPEAFNHAITVMTLMTIMRWGHDTVLYSARTHQTDQKWRQL